jgi:hypothetical protein
MFLSTIAAVIGIAGGVNSIYQSNKSKPGAGGATDDAARAADPFGQFRTGFGQQLTGQFGSLTNPNPQDIANDPNYQFQLQQGMGAVNKGAAASGMLGSGTRLLDLQKMGQGLASNFEDKQWGRNMSILQMLGQFSGATTGSPGGAANAMMQGNANSQNQLNGGLGNIMSGLGGLSRSNWSLGNMGGSGGAPDPMIWNNGGGYGGG